MCPLPGRTSVERCLVRHGPVIPQARKRQTRDAVVDGLTAALVTEFVLTETAERKAGSAKFVGCGQRAFLRFAFVTRRTTAELDVAVPKIASWRLSGVPRALSQADVAWLVGSCDR